MFFDTMFYLKLSIFTIILNSASSTIYPRHRIKENENIDLLIRSGPQAENVFDRKLIQKNPSINDIIIENDGYFENTNLRNFPGKVMASVTLSYNNGYEVSRNLEKKFDIISPNTFAICRTGRNSYQLKENEPIGENWKNSINRPIYPRFELFEFTADDYLKLFSFYSERRAFNELILQACRDNKFQGIVLELWIGLINYSYENNLYNLVAILSNDLKAEGFNIILSIPPIIEKAYFTAKNFEHLYSHVEYFNLKSYEYYPWMKKLGYKKDAIAPLPWMRKAVEMIVPSTVANNTLKRNKILMGINLFGFHYRPNMSRDIVNGEYYIHLIKYYKNGLNFDDVNIEHSINISNSDGRHIINYPTLYTINERIKLANELGVGLSLIDLSLGLNYFYDLF